MSLHNDGIQFFSLPFIAARTDTSPECIGSSIREGKPWTGGVDVSVEGPMVKVGVLVCEVPAALFLPQSVGLACE